MPHLSHQHLAAVSTAISDSSYPTNAMPQWPTLSPGLLHTTQVQPFAPPNPATAAQIEEAKDVWRKHKLTFELCQATEKALIAQIVDSIDSIYLRALLNRVTGQYSNSIRAVLAHLFTTHGKITPQQVKATEMAVYYSMNYSIILPVDTVFNSIDDLADLAGHANSPLTPQQMIDLAFVILAKEPSHSTTGSPPLESQTHSRAHLGQHEAIDHFREAQTDLSSLPTAGGVYHQQPPHHANSAVTIADLVTQRLLDAYPPTTEENIATASPNEVANAHDVANAAVLQREASIASREAALLSQMQEMMSTFRAGNKNRNNRGSNRGNRNNNSNHQGRTNDGNPTGGRGRTQSPRSYCWTHGACAHSSAQCNTQTTGHQTTATFANMQGGSTNNCFWLPA
jgi:hypothetical protein